MHELITKCASSAPDADFADFADLVRTPPGQPEYMMNHWNELIEKSLLPVPGRLSSSIVFSGKSGLARARRSADE